MHRRSRPAADDDTEAAYRALVLGTRDYVRKCGFKKVLVALSGGIDSALVAAIATEALGQENVVGVGMPEPILTPAVRSMIAGSWPPTWASGLKWSESATCSRGSRTRWSRFSWARKRDTTEENIQSRIRGTLMMALSNKFSSLVLTTGNKSEMAVGYCTLYGDMVGALAVIGDLVKNTCLFGLLLAQSRPRSHSPFRSSKNRRPRNSVPARKIRIHFAPFTRCWTQSLRPTLSRYETPERIAEANGFSLCARPTGGAPG